MNEYNAKLPPLLNTNELNVNDMNKIHELSYTLENALLRITEEVNLMAENLEEVQLASGRMDHQIITT